MSTTVPKDPTARELFDEMSRWPIYDPHSHIDAHRPAARNLDEVLGYHYYTELAHSAGMPAERVDAGLSPQVRARHLAQHLHQIDNTVQYSWLLEIARTFYGFTHDRITPDTIEELYDRAERTGDGAAWDQEVWNRSQLEAVFLTNDFDDPLEGWDTEKFVPCLRTDDLVLKLHEQTTVDRLIRSTGVDVQDVATLQRAIGVLFRDQVRRRGCAGLRDQPSSRLRAAAGQPEAGDNASSRRMPMNQMGYSGATRHGGDPAAWSSGPLAEYCADFRLPFDLMIGGPIRNVYPAGVAEGTRPVRPPGQSWPTTGCCSTTSLT